MKIGFDSKRLYSNFTGLGNYSRSVVKNLQKLYPNNEYNLYTPKLKQSAETAFFYESPFFRTYLAKTVFKSFWRTYSIVKQLQKDGIELYHGLSNEIPANLRKTKIASIVTIHDLIFKVLPETYPYIDRKVYDLKVRKSCLNADRIIAVSNSTKRDIVQYYTIDPDKIDVIYPSCNPLFYENLQNSERDTILNKYDVPNEYLLYVGTVEKRKNLKVIIEAYQHLTPECRIPLIIIGGGKAYKNEIVRLIQETGLEKNVIWINKLKDNHHLQLIYQNAMALIYPSFYEGFGLPVVEALLSKTPVITSNSSSLPEAGGPGSIYINPNDAEELAHAITKILTDVDFRNKMIEQGYEYAHETFAADRVTHQLMNCYKKTVHNKK